MAARRIGRDAISHAALVDPLRRLLLSRIDVDDRALGASLGEHLRLVHVIAHGGSLSWLPIYVALMSKMREHAPKRLHVGSFHKALWRAARPLIAFIAGTDRHLTYAELERVLGEIDSDFWAFPESENSMYGDLFAIKPFRFLRFIEVAVKARMPMLLVAHVGSEVWYRTFAPPLPRVAALARSVPDALYGAVSFDKPTLLARLASENLHLPLPMGRVHLRIATALHVPAHFEHGYSVDPQERAAELRLEADAIRGKLQALTDGLRGGGAIQRQSASETRHIAR
jgi:hypothetical protein